MRFGYELPRKDDPNVVRDAAAGVRIKTQFFGNKRPRDAR
jgi:hypothetical protein